MADGEATTETVGGEVPAAPPTAENPAVPAGGAGLPPNPPYAPYPYAPYPWGPPPGGVPYPVSAPPVQHAVAMSRLGAVLGAFLLLLVGVGVGVGIGAAVWSGSSAQVAFRVPRNVTPTGSIHVGTGRRLPATGPGTAGPGRIGNGGFRFGGGGFGGTTGTITKVSGTTVTVKEPNGSTTTVKVPSSAKITVTKTGGKSDLSSGACVRIVGGPTVPTPGGSASGDARAVQVLPASACPSS